jgi:hypothetical protein
MQFILADSAYLIEEGDARCRIRYQIKAPRGTDAPADFLARFEAWLQENRRNLRLWDTHEFPLTQSPSAAEPPRWMLVVALPFRQTAPNRVATHYIVLLDSKLMWTRGDWKPVLQMEEELFVLVSAWFTWHYTQREERQRLLQQLTRKDLDQRERRRLIKTLQWPVPFQDLVGLLQTAWDAESPATDEEKMQFNQRWLKEVGNRLCLSDPERPGRRLADSLCRKRRTLCGRCDERVKFNLLAAFLEWRFTPPQDRPAFNRPPAGIDPFMMAEADDGLARKALARFFAENFWRKWLSVKKHALALGPRERQRSLSYCAHLVHYLLGDLPVDEKTIDALVWSVSRYGHDCLGIEPRLDLSAHLLQAARVEPALHVLRPYHRDHFFHAVEVCFLGHYLLVAQPKKGRTLLKQCVGYLGDTPKKVLAEWYVAALLHDIGYAIEVLAGARRMLEFYGQSAALGALAQGIDEQIKRLSRALASQVKVFSVDDKPGEDHGAVGAAHLNSLIEGIRKQKKGVSAYTAAQHAIAVHNHRAKEVTFREHPLAFLLILCDTIQQWNRAHLHYATAPEIMLSKLLRGGTVEDLTGPLKRIDVDWEDDTLSLSLLYSEAINQNAGVFRLWLDSTSNLQRLRASGLDFGIKVSFVTPFFRKVGEPQSQMARLKDAAEETRMNFLADWFPPRSEPALTYAPDQEHTRDVLTLDLRRVDGKRLITEPMGVFWKRLASWSRYNEDRDFLDDVGLPPPS